MDALSYTQELNALQREGKFDLPQPVLAMLYSISFAATWMTVVDSRRLLCRVSRLQGKLLCSHTITLKFVVFTQCLSCTGLLRVSSEVFIYSIKRR